MCVWYMTHTRGAANTCALPVSEAVLTMIVLFLRGSLYVVKAREKEPPQKKHSARYDPER